MSTRDFKKALRDTLDISGSKGFMFVNTTIGLFAAASVFLALAELLPYLHRYESALLIVDWATTLFFTAEYAVRLWVADRKWAYIRSPLGLVDLISFVPTYLGLGNFAFLKAARFIRISRLSRVTNLTNTPKVIPKRDQKRRHG